MKNDYSAVVEGVAAKFLDEYEKKRQDRRRIKTNDEFKVAWLRKSVLATETGRKPLLAEVDGIS